MIGRSGSRGLPKKNIKKVCGRYLCEYSLIAAKNSKYVNCALNYAESFS